MATAAIATAGERVGFGRRFVALLIDGAILTVANIAVGSAAGDPGAASGLTTLIGIVYVIGFWLAWNGQTPGKRAMGIRVVKTDGSAFGLVPAVLRYVGYFVSSIVLFLGFIWVLFDKDKQGWHDKIASTYVVKA